MRVIVAQKVRQTAARKVICNRSVESVAPSL